MILLQVAVIIAIVAFLVFLARDDRRNRMLRAQEDLEARGEEQD